MAAEEEDWARLIAAIDSRLDGLAIKLKDIEERGGPSASKIRELRNGRSKTLVRSKRRDLERALEWQHGSVDWILAGGDPRPISQTSNGAPAGETWIDRLTTPALWDLYMEVSAAIRSRLPNDTQDWRDGWSPPKGEDPGVGLDENGE